MTSAKGISVQILGRQHTFSCPEEQEISLIKAANDLDGLLKDIKKQSGSANNERVLLVAALNLSHQLLIANNKDNEYCHRLDALINIIKTAL